MKCFNCGSGCGFKNMFDKQENKEVTKCKQCGYYEENNEVEK